MRAFIYLNLHLLKNTIKNVLITPKKLFIFLFFGIFIFLPLFSLSFIVDVKFEPPFTVETLGPVIFIVLTMATFALVILSILADTLVFSPSEVDFLFPSPLKRRTILLNRIITGYLINAGMALIAPLVVLFMFSIVFVFSFWHRLLFSCTATALTVIFALNIGWLLFLMGSHGSEFKRSRASKVLLTCVALLLGALSLYLHWSVIQGIPLVDALLHFFRSTVLKVTLFPMAMAADVAVAWTLTLPVGLEILGLVCICLITLGAVLSVDARFYEAAEKISKEKWAMRQKVLAKEVVVSESFARRMFKIQPFGEGLTVLVWKNLVGALRDIRNVSAVLVIATVYLFMFGETYGSNWAFFVALLTVTNLRWDLREDLRRIEIVKLIPAPSLRVVLSEIAVPTLFSTLFSWIFLVVSTFVFSEFDLSFVFNLFFLPLFCAITAIVFNLTSLYYPPQTTNQIFTALVGMIVAGIVFSPLLGILIFFDRGGMYGLLTFFGYAVVAYVLLKLLAGKYSTFDVTSS